MSYNLSACVFIKDCFKGAFCLFESIASLLPFATEFVVMDLGSTDGTLEVLQDITKANSKFKLIKSDWPVIDAKAFALLANDLIDFCHYDNVLYYQADEIWHESLLKLMSQKFDEGQFDLSFWRIQYRDNFQHVKWFPHLVHRVGQKENFHFTGDGMNSNRTYDAKVCSNFGAEFFPLWGGLGDEKIKPYVHEMIMDVSSVGGFRDNIIEKRALHAPFWHESPTIENVEAVIWAENARRNPDWTKPESPFNLPKIMRYHVGKIRYELRGELLEAIKADDTRELVGL